MPAPGRAPTVRRRRLAAELRRLRELAELNLEDAAPRLGWSIAKHSRIETARVSVTVSDVKKMLDVYGVESSEKREAVLGLARTARLKGWWDAYSSSLPSDYANYISLEAEAASLQCFDALVFHGLFQTEEYAREVTRASLMGLSSPAEVERRVEVRLTRQNRLTTDDNPLRFWTVIDESALARVVGSPKVMREQLAHLLEISTMDHITIQVLRSSGAHPALQGSFAIMEFPERYDPDVVYVETMTSNLYVEDDDEVYRYTLAFDHLRAKALGPDESRDYIAQAANSRQ